MKVLIFLLLGTISASMQTVPPDLKTFLKERVDFTQQDFRALELREAVTKMLNTDKKPEVAVFGIMYVEVPADFFIDKFRDIETFMKSSSVVEMGTFENPAQANNLSELTLEPEELVSIKECEVGKCNLKLSAAMIDRIRREVDWSASNCRERVTELVKEMMVGYVKAYSIGGSASMVQYDDQKYPLRSADEFHELLQESDFLYEYVPQLHRYLEVYPQDDLPGTENVIYWCKRKYDKLRPIVSINHVTLFRQSQGKAKTLIASKQIYANHYFEASFELTALVETELKAGRPGFYFLYLNRSRFDTLRKKFLPGMQHTIRSEILKKINQEMNSTRVQLESLYREEVSPTKQ